MRNKFLRIFELYYDITNGKPQIFNRPDVKIEMSSISWSIRIYIFLHGFIADSSPDYTYCLTDESSEDEFDRAISMLELCKETVEISKKAFRIS